MATKSILKNVTIKGKKNCAMFANALENAYKKSSKEIGFLKGGRFERQENSAQYR